MQNPWQELPNQPEYLLPSDRAAVDEFNASSNPEHRLHLELLREPFLGRPDAPVVLLNLNPGFSDEDGIAYADPYFTQTCWANLLHTDQTYPFYLLKPKYSGFSGPRWWATHLHSLLRRFGPEHLAKSVLCVEFFPYHSSNYHPLGTTLESQQYSFWLVCQAMERDAVIVGLRGRGYWDEAIPELAQYHQIHWLKNRQRVWVTPGNCPDGSYDEIVTALNR